MFAGDRLISSVIISNGFDITKQDIKAKVSNNIVESNPLLSKGNLVFTFGKYKGDSIADIYNKDSRYLYWIASDKFETFTSTASKTKKNVCDYLKNINLVNNVK